MKVFVINMNGEPLMPCSQRKARLLLKEGKAKVIQREPFTIQLNYGSSGYKQDITKGKSILVEMSGNKKALNSKKVELVYNRKNIQNEGIKKVVCI